MAVGKSGKGMGRKRISRARSKSAHDTQRMTERKPPPAEGKETMKGGFRPGWEIEDE